MQVSDLVNQYHNSLNAGSKIAKKTKGIEQLSKTVSSLEKGQVFEGTVKSVKGDKVTLALSSGQSITARLDKGMSLSEGQSVFFQVKSNEGGTVQIRPVQSEFGGNPTLLNALKNAGLPENELNLKLVNAMMKEQMPIDKDSIKDMIRTVRAHPDANVETLVSLKKLDMPVSDSMITQFENYKQSEGAILKMVDSLADDIPKTLSAENVSKEDVVAFQNSLLEIISEDSDTPTNIVGDKPLPQDASGAQMAKVIVGEGQSQTQTTGGIQVPVEELPSASGNTNNSNISGAGGMQPATAQSVVQANVANVSDVVNEMPVKDAQTATGEAALPKGTIGAILSDEGAGQLQRVLNDYPEIARSLPNMFDENGIIRPEVKGADLLKSVNTLFANNPNITKADMLSFMESKPIKELTNSLMSDAWTLEPKELTKKGSVDRLYEKIEEDMERIIETAKHTTHSDISAVTSTAQGVKDNLSFIREVNQIYQYVQIPLQMSGEKTTGDLYVYSNKKQKRAENDEITAFLHFDMENLGSTDISVKLAGKKLDTKFFLEDDISFQIVENNLHILEQRLKDLGYNCNLEVENDGKEINFVEDFLKQDVKSAGDIRRYSFDVRA